MRTIGKYEVVEKIGEGGFGVIFKGFDPHIRRFVAIKSCTSEEQDVRDRFLHEAQIAGNLQHRHIVTVYDFGLQDGVPYLVQEYLSGEDLDRKIKRKDFIPLPEKLLYLMQVARGLEYAHSKGVVHRDIKPANIRILEDGTAKIMDFGIAKLTDQDTGLTQTGMTLGTAAYLAPEQIKGETIGPFTDIFSWGVTAWELLASTRPFTGQHISTVLYQILHESPQSLQRAAPDLPSDLVAVVEHCLEKKPGQRYASCTEVLRDLDGAIQRHRPTGSRAFATVAAPSPVELAATRSLPAAARPATATAAIAPAAADSELGELELDSTASGRTPHSISATRALRSRGFPLGVWTTAVLLIVCLSGVGWWATHRGRHAAPAPREQAASALPRRTPTAARMMLAASAAGGHPTAVPATVPPPLAAAPAPMPVATPPPTPKPSFIVVPAAWSPDVWVSVGHQRRALGEQQRFRVEPGTATTVRFEYDGPYRDAQERTVRVAEGATTRVDIPLARPAELQVQQQMGTPLGRVFLDGKDLGPPIVRRVAKAGGHELRIEAAMSGAAPLVEQLDLQPGQKLIVTFDLAQGKLRRVIAPPA